MFDEVYKVEKNPTDLTVQWWRWRCCHTDQDSGDWAPNYPEWPGSLLVTNHGKMTTLSQQTHQPSLSSPDTVSTWRVSLEEAQGWGMRLRGTRCHSWCYYCRSDDQYRPSPWQSPRHVTMVSVVMTLVAMVIFPPVECQVAPSHRTWLPAASYHHQHWHLINSWRAEILASTTNRHISNSIVSI